MLARLLFLFIVVPLVELTLLLTIAKYTSVTFTLGMVLVTGVVGSILARSQGWAAYRRIHQEVAGGTLPKESLLDALMILVAGMLLVTPGVITDLFGLSLLIPPCRRLYRQWAANWIRRR